ncbi:MAG: hypothetical protein KDC80_04465 [Saprospiraceae bacterium]|nr:hypothetical protein [Saprospiraceae bacterium]
MTKILILLVAAYMVYRFFTRTRQLETPEDIEVGEDVFVDYEEVKDE